MSDFPDYFGQQTFPKFGPFAVHPVQVDTIIDTGDVFIFDLNANAMIYSLNLYISNAIGFDGIELLITIDSAYVVAHPIDTLYDYSIAVPHGYPLMFSSYNPTGKKFTLVGAQGITFREQFRLRMINDTGNTIYARGDLYYASVI